jgi:xanthine dehydrogenase YagR molybdenum-binding subunit
MTWGKGAGLRWPRSAADGLGLDLDRIEFRSGTSDLPRRRHRRRLRAYRDPRATRSTMLVRRVIAKLAELATNDERFAAVRRR